VNVNPLPIQPYDLVMLAVLAMATLFGLWKGMAWQVASLASLVVSFVVAARMSGQVAPMISAQEPWNRFIAMLLLYLATSAGIWLAFRLVAGIIDRIRLKDFDRQVGALIGLAKGALLCLVITFFAVTLSESLRQNVLTTYSGRTIATVIKQTSPIMPPEVRNVLGTYIDQLDRRLDPASPPETPPASKRLAIPLTAELPRAAAELPRAAEALGVPQRPIWDWQGQPSSAPPAREAAPVEPPERPPQIPLFPVKIPSRDRT
jgi:membrane protein required for colicin V production